MSVTDSLSPCHDGYTASTMPLLAFLERVQETAFITFGDKDFDPKRYVDLPLKYDLNETREAFDRLLKKGKVSGKELKSFIADYFEEAGSDLVYHDPEDFVPEPHGFFPKVESWKAREWALEVHSLWQKLSRKVSDDVKKHPDLHTLLPLPRPVIVPGSRFQEVYYWDSYWVIRGLLASKMYETAKAIVTNLIYLLDTYGHVLNGARSYYINRSQPPLLSAMVREIFDRTGDMELAKKALPALLKEHEFWNSDVHKVTVQDNQATNHTLNRYYAMWNKPRPESSTLDRKSASGLTNESEKQQLYREIASTAESGWDFSTRWMRNSSDFTSLATTSIVPVDLNSYILKLELDIAFLAIVTGKNKIAENFLEASQARKVAINSVLWSAKSGQWLDYWLSSGSTCKEPETWKACNQNQNAFASNFIPLWIDVFRSDPKVVENVIKSLQNSGLLHSTGIATSLTNSGQQWDFPNGWAPLQHMIVEGLARSCSATARALAEDIVVKWIRTNYVAYKISGAMHEKYDVEKCGEFGGGGEYIPQTGFGWTNGVVLAFLEEFGWPADRKLSC